MSHDALNRRIRELAGRGKFEAAPAVHPFTTMIRDEVARQERASYGYHDEPEPDPEPATGDGGGGPRGRPPGSPPDVNAAIRQMIAESRGREA